MNTLLERSITYHISCIKLPSKTNLKKSNIYLFEPRKGGIPYINVLLEMHTWSWKFRNLRTEVIYHSTTLYK